MKDDVPTGTLMINKKGEFLDKVSALDSVGGWIKHVVTDPKGWTSVRKGFEKYDHREIYPSSGTEVSDGKSV